MIKKKKKSSLDKNKRPSLELLLHATPADASKEHTDTKRMVYTGVGTGGKKTRSSDTFKAQLRPNVAQKRRRPACRLQNHGSHWNDVSGLQEAVVTQGQLNVRLFRPLNLFRHGRLGRHTRGAAGWFVGWLVGTKGVHRAVPTATSERVQKTRLRTIRSP